MDQLIENIYQAAHTPELWPQVMEELAISIGAASTTLLHRETACSEGPIVDVSFGTSPWQMESYAAYFNKLDSLSERYHEIQKLSVGQVLADDHHFDFEAYSETEIYQDFWKPAKRGAGMTGVFFKDLARISLISARRYIDREAFTDSEVRTFRKLLPHLRRSLQFHDHLTTAKLRADALGVALDQFPVAVFLVDQNCTVHDRNRAAQEFLADSNAPMQICDQKLAAYFPDQDRALREAVRIGADSLHSIEAEPCFVRLQMRNGLGVVVLVPVPINRSLVGTSGDLVLLICRQTTTSYVDPVKLQRQFGFTPAESRLAIALAEGATLEDFATKRGISVGTVRTQVKSAMDKADVHTQAQLVGVVLRSVAAFVRGA